MKIDDLVITVAYVWIPLQIVVALARYPRLTSMPLKIWCLLVLVGFFFILCGAGHFMRALDYNHTAVYRVNNWFTALISSVAALYSLPLIPMLVSRLDQNLQDLMQYCHETEESQRKLRTFMSFLCHEIRNPLFAITSALTFLTDDELSEDQERTVETIRQSSELMLRLVNDILDLSKLESGKLEMEERTFDLRQLLEGVIATADTQIKRKHGGTVVFQSRITDSVPRLIRSDSVRLLQIVYNLLSNANKFTVNGVIEFNVTTCDYSEALYNKCILGPNEVRNEGSDHVPNDPGETNDFATRLLEATEEGTRQEHVDESNATVLKLIVKDTGIGIAPDRVQDIFQPYTQGKLSDYRNHGGTGLGLSIVSQLTRGMGGTIDVSSAEDTGTTFVVHLPLRKALLMDDDLTEETTDCSFNLLGLSEACSMESQKPIASPNASPKRKDSSLSVVPPFDLPKNSSVVLVVDDNEINLKLIGRMLSSFNVEYMTAQHGQEAVDIMATSRNVTHDPSAPQFGLIMMDMQMPVMDGVDAISYHRNKQHLTLPILALTANALDEWKQKALQAGASSFATKPILRDELYATCKRYLQPEETNET